MTSPAVLTTDAQTLAVLLRHFDWSPISKIPGLYEVWSTEDKEDEEILVPLDPSRGDYAALLTKARRTVYEHYGRAARDISAMLELRVRASLDATQWKKETQLEAGIIEWEAGEKLYEAARAQLIASAKSAREKRRYHGNASAHLAKRFIENSFMGQTDIGSFVITAYTPANTRFHLSKHSEEMQLLMPRASETVTGRQVLATFERALKAVSEGIQSYRQRPQIEIFLETVQEGVSYEFTKALSELTSDGDSEIEIMRFSDSADRQIAKSITFEAVDSPILTRAAHAFALDPEPQHVTLVGEVTLLSRSVAKEDHVIRLNIAEGADVRKARIRLTAEQYKLAMEAHRFEASLRVRGRLEKEGNLYWLYDPIELEIVPPDENPAAELYETPTIF